MKITSLHFQRNGVSGNSFYTVYYTDNSHPDFSGNMIATFEEAEGYENKIDRRTCRVINTDKPDLSYRGDEIAEELQLILDKMLMKATTNLGIYEFTENNKRITKIFKTKYL